MKKYKHMQLNNNTLESLADKIRVPKYNRSKVTAGIVHIGLGNFQRSHQSVYTEKALEKADQE